MPTLGFGAVAGGTVSAGETPGSGVLLNPYSAEAVIYEYTYTSGTDSYALAGAWSTHLPFSARFPGGATGITYYVTDGSSGVGSQYEVGIGDYDDTARTLSRLSVFASSNNNQIVDWSGRTRLLVRPLVEGLPLCSTPPTAGQTLIWDAVNNEWCPGSAVSSVFYISFSYGATFSSLPSDPLDGSLEIFDVVVPTAVTFPVNLGSSPTPICEVAPATDTTLTLETWIGGVKTNSGRLSYSTGQLTGSYTFTSLVLPAGGRLRLQVNPIEDATIAGIAGTIVGTR